MLRVSMSVKVLSCVLMLAAAAHPASAFDGCRAADINGDGVVDPFDKNLIAPLGTPSPRNDIDGSGFMDAADQMIVDGFSGRPCIDCIGDLDGSGIVDGADRAVLENAYGRDCRLDLDRNDTVDGDDVDLWVIYWQSPPSPATARADFDDNPGVDYRDINALIPTIGNDCRPDLNKDGLINTNDLWFLLASWGSCP